MKPGETIHFSVIKYLNCWILISNGNAHLFDTKANLLAWLDGEELDPIPF